VSGEAGVPVLTIDGPSGSGKGTVSRAVAGALGWRLLDSGARVTIVDPLGVWWGLRASADGSAAGYPVVVFGGKHADVLITAEIGAALGRLIASAALACVIDLSELGSNAARRRFMAAFSEALYEANEEPLHLVLDDRPRVERLRLRSVRCGRIGDRGEHDWHPVVQHDLGTHTQPFPFQAARVAVEARRRRHLQ